MNKRTALVYFGAAFLIIVFGFKTLARSTDSLKFLEDFLTPITIFALLLEFFLLVYYAKGIYDIPEINAKTIGSKNSTSPFPGDSNIENFNSSLDTLNENMSNINNHLETHNKEIVNLNKKIEDLLDEQLDHKIKNILSSIIRKS